ncbi:MAG: hypothetical protein Q7T87_10065 [Polaromonas sp.]|nr:hypothetical protein [Polaromonas sp.]
MPALHNNRHALPRAFTALAAGLVLSTASFASSPDAWAAHDKEVAATCATASGLKNAAAAGVPMVFDDSIGKTALVIAGHYPQPHMKNARGRVLCLFDHKTRQAVVTEADQLTVAPARAATRPRK